MNLLEKIKSLHLDKMVVTNSELSFFLYNSSDALSHDKETKIAVEKCMEELDYENRDGTERGYFKYEPALVPVPKTTQDVVNPFKKFTDELAKTLKVKNDAYADSFDKTLDKFGLNVAVARINDKYDRLENIILHPDTEQNDESPKDTLMDLAGYSILLVKYMESRGLYSD